MTAPMDVLAVMQAHTEVVADSVRLLEEPCVRLAVDTNSHGFSYAAGTVVPRLLSSFVDLHEARAGIAELIASQEKSREVLRAIVRDKKGGVHLSAALAACHQANAALAAVGVQS